MEPDKKPFSPLDAIREIRAMPELELRQQLMSFGSSIYVFDANYLELQGALNALLNDPGDDLTAQFNFLRLTQICMEISRRLHNFVASAYSLRDHTYALHRKLYHSTGKLPGYDLKVKTTFANDPVCGFVQSLRNYCLHYKSIGIGVRQSFQREGDQFVPSRSAFLSVESLRAFDAWTKPALKYITDHTNDGTVDIVVAIDRYRAVIKRFCDWFSEKQQEIHRDELDRLRAKEVELALFELGTTLTISLVNSDIQYQARDMFSGLLTPEELLEIGGLRSNPEEAAEQTIAFLDQDFEISEEIKAKIRRLYSETPFLTKAFSA